MNIHKSAEDYLERILMLQKSGMKVRSIDIAQSFKYSRASVSRAINNLKNSNHILVDENGIITLTNLGKNVAEKMYNRHKLLTEFFVSLGVKTEVALEDACKIEHDLSEETFVALTNHINKK